MPYLNVMEVESALMALSATYPGLCELILLPNPTHEGRISHAVRIAQGSLDYRPAMLFIGGQHAREWGSCEICINVAADLLEAYSTGAGLTYGGQSFTALHVKAIVENSQIVIFACVNPDGRHYSQTRAAMWRKNRNPASGVDLNRNYDFLWDFRAAFSPSSPVVVSDVPAHDTYHGTVAASEPETRNVVWLLDTYPQIRWMVDIHSFSGFLCHNWGDDQNQGVDTSVNFRNPAYDGMRGVASDAYGEYIRANDQTVETCLIERLRDALKAVRGTTYSVGQSFTVVYPTSGTASDYAYGRHWMDPAKTNVLGFLIEWGTQFQPPWLEMEKIILDVSSALVAFAVAAPFRAEEVAVAPLSDGRLQVWAADAQCRLVTTWKVSTDPEAAWAPWSDFVAAAGLLPARPRQVALASLPDGRLELWVVDANGGLFSTWKSDPDPNADWVPWSDFLGEVGSLPAEPRHICVAPLPDGRLHLWVTDANGGLFAVWKVDPDPNAGWTIWTDFLAEVGSLPAGAREVAVAPLPDGRLQLWVTDANGGLFTTWKVDADPNALWAPWSDFLAEVGGLPAAARQVAVAPLPDGRLQLWVTDANGGLFTTWKVDTDPNASWTPWSDFLAEVGGLPAAALEVAVAPLPDARLHLWVTDALGGLFTTWKADTDPNANWLPWFDFTKKNGPEYPGTPI